MAPSSGTPSSSASINHTDFAKYSMSGVDAMAGVVDDVVWFLILSIKNQMLKFSHIFSSLFTHRWSFNLFVSGMHVVECFPLPACAIDYLPSASFSVWTEVPNLNLNLVAVRFSRLDGETVALSRMVKRPESNWTTNSRNRRSASGLGTKYLYFQEKPRLSLVFLKRLDFKPTLHVRQID
ncbi:hypothetical protein DFH09DRAFT_1092899 [Mycena vulgaris]|nr:hypothetical protein DFH09DRAFT_1092899 [Mycena vulgaris]